MKALWSKAATSLLTAALVLGLGSPATEAQTAGAAKTAVPKLEFESNRPFGDAKGIFPGRVAWCRDASVARWDGKTGHWWDEGNIDTRGIVGMYDRSLCALSGAATPREAWDKIFRYFNRQHHRGDKGYAQGELVAVKINLNNSTSPDDHDNEIDMSPQGTMALLHELTQNAGVPQADIVVYDASIGWGARSIPHRLYDPVHRAYPRVRWMSANGGPGIGPANWVIGAITYTDPSATLGNELPKDVMDATYLVNIALLKGHEIAGITCCAKNHFGSIKWPIKMHETTSVHQMKGRPGDYSCLVDLMGSPNLGGKTLLYVVDGIYGMQTNTYWPKPERDRWKMFGNQWSSSYFFSLDPVAIECVCLDFLFAEFGENLGFSGAPQFEKGSSHNCDNYLKEAARGVNAKSGPYRPNGVEVGSLGVFEHWNNARDKQYSRNLGKNEGIELYVVK